MPKPCAAAEPMPSEPMVELPELDLPDDEPEDDEEKEVRPANRLLAPRNPADDVAVDELPDPVLCTVGADVSEAPDDAEVPAEAELPPEEELPGLPPPAVLTTVTWLMVVPPPVMVTFTPPRLPRSCGTTSELYFSAAVTPVTRSVSSMPVLAATAVRTERAGLEAVAGSPACADDSRWAEKRPIPATARMAARSHQAEGRRPVPAWAKEFLSGRIGFDHTGWTRGRESKRPELHRS